MSERQSALFERGAASQQTAEQAAFERRARREELTSARLGIRVADSQVRMAQAALGRHNVRGGDEVLEVPSPIAGQVLRVLHDQEGVVQPGAPIVEIGDPAGLEVVVDVLTSSAVLIHPGAPVTLTRWGGEAVLDGRVQRVEPSAFTRVSSLGVEEQRVNVVADIDTEWEVWSSLGNGYRVEAQIQVWTSEEALQVPASSLFRTSEGWSTYRVQDGHAEKVAIEVGERSGLQVEVRSGLRVSDRVVVHPSDSLQDGAAIELR